MRLFFDLITQITHCRQFFLGGFSYADTLGSAKGWAASIMYSKDLAPQFHHFKNRPDTFSLGVCNGCQLMSLIGWIGVENTAEIVPVPDVALLENRSERLNQLQPPTFSQFSFSILKWFQIRMSLGNTSNSNEQINHVTENGWQCSRVLDSSR